MILSTCTREQVAVSKYSDLAPRYLKLNTPMRMLKKSTVIIIIHLYLFPKKDF